MDSATTHTFGRPGSRLSQGRYTDFAIALTLAIVTGLLVNWQYGHFAKTLIDASLWDVWFDSDIPRVVKVMTSRLSEMHYRIQVHPLHSLIVYPPTWVLKQFLGTALAVRAVTVGIAAAWTVGIYVLFRLIGCLRQDAVLFCLLATGSSAFLFWATVPETYTLGSITIVLALAFCAWTLREDRVMPLPGFSLVSAATLSVTITNWMVGLCATFASMSLRKAIRVTLMAFGLVSLLWGLQKILFPHAVYFLEGSEEQTYLFHPGLHRIIRVLVSAISTSVVAPEVLTTGVGANGWSNLSFQQALPGSSGLLGVTGNLLWCAILALGFAGLCRQSFPYRFRLVVFLSLTGQVTLHLIYGAETFLYSMHFLPMLLAVAAFGATGRQRIWSRALVVLLIPVLWVNNFSQLASAHNRILSPREALRLEMERRPDDLWPRGNGHVLLAAPGSTLMEKSYHEPGGSLSPGFGSFGIGLWMRDATGSIQIADALVPMQQLRQALVWRDSARLPEIETTTDSYWSSWQVTGVVSRQLKFENLNPGALTSELVIRAAGPAGGPVSRLSWNGMTLLVNGRWSISLQTEPERVVLGTESDRQWKSLPMGPSEIRDPSGWAFARIDMGHARNWVAEVQDITGEGSAPDGPAVRAMQDLDLPDSRFADSLNAQVAHMMMATEGEELRPGDPGNYPLNWQRDGAYEIVALTRAGQLDAATRLAKRFAETDYFGGFGAEADAPGLSIWALMTVADQKKSGEYDRWLWPHVERKAQDILFMLRSTENVYRDFSGPVVPFLAGNAQARLVAEPARDGLIQGRMDHHRPLLFVNAVSYRGLLEAARLAERLGSIEQASAWRDGAAEVRNAWRAGLQTSEADNERTLISALWPTWIGSQDAPKLETLLLKEQDKSAISGNPDGARPDSTYFDIAMAHQWLFLSEPDVVWKTVNWFWNHQDSPGLYTWWEGSGEENSFGLWSNAMGWVYPRGVAPHYWTAAELTLLQLDMLAYLDESGDEPVLVVGGGVPASWLHSSLRASGLRVGEGVVDWEWDGKEVRLKTRKLPRLKVRLGAAFPGDVSVRQERSASVQ